MAGLTGQTVASSYVKLLNLVDGAITGSAQVVEDGLGNPTKLSLSDAGVTSTGFLTVDGISTLTGAVTVAGALAANGGITCDTNKFIVADTTGNTTIAGTLGVTLVATLSDTTDSSSSTTGGTIIKGGCGIAMKLFVGTTLDVAGASALDGAVTMGAAATVGTTLGVTGILTASGGVTGDLTGDLTGDVKAADGTSVLDSGTDGADASFIGDVKAEDGVVILTSGTGVAASSIANGVTATTQPAGTADTTVATTAYADSTGKVLQVVFAKTDAVTFSATTSSTMVDITGVTATITPSSADNDVLVTVTMTFGTNNGNYVGFGLKRDGTQIGSSGDSGVTGNRVACIAAAYSQYDSVAYFVSYQYLDSPASTSATVYLATVSGRAAHYFQLNRSYTDPDADYNHYGISTITLTEIAG